MSALLYMMVPHARAYQDLSGLALLEDIAIGLFLRHNHVVVALVDDAAELRLTFVLPFPCTQVLLAIPQRVL